MKEVFKNRCLLLFVAMSLVLTSCKDKYAEIVFDNQIFDFGTIVQGDKVVHDFKFTNTGNADLVITDAKGSCGCTVPEYPTEPIEPGESGIIKVSFNSAGKSGETSKTVTITCNVKDGAKILYIKAKINVPKKRQKN